MTDVAIADGVDDPFEAFNRAMGAGIADPYSRLAELRATGPVIRVEGFGDLGINLYNALSYDAVNEILRDGERFPSSGYDEVMGLVMGHTILAMDEPEHRAYRSLIAQAFSRKAMEGWERDLVVPIVDQHIDEFADEGRAELVSRLFFPFPVAVIAAMLGLAPSELARFHRLAVELISVSIDMDLAQRASQSLADLLLPLVHQRRDEPGIDMISVLATAEHDGQRLTDDEIIAFCRLLLPAGAETTYRSSSNLVTGLLSHPEAFDEVRADRSLIPTAIEEGLRWEPPLLMILRTAAVDTEVCGVELPAGARIMINIGSANHDDRRWPNPQEFDLHRDAKAHIAFASGPHMCLGLHLARMETRVVLERLLDRLPGLRLDEAEPPPCIVGETFRAPLRLDVRFDT
jgi:cytochrome P450